MTEVDEGVASSTSVDASSPVEAGGDGSSLEVGVGPAPASVRAGEVPLGPVLGAEGVEPGVVMLADSEGPIVPASFGLTEGASANSGGSLHATTVSATPSSVDVASMEPCR